MNATASKPPARTAAMPGTAAPPADAISGAKPDAAASAKSLRVDGTLPAAQWGVVLDAVATEIERRNAEAVAKRASTRAKRWVGAAATVVASIGVAFAFAEFAGVALFVIGLVIVFRLFRMPTEQIIGLERLGFVRELVGELAKGAARARIGLRAQLDARQAIDERPLAPGRVTPRSESTREEAWLRGELRGLPGLYLGWSVTEWHTLTHVRKRNARGRTKTKAKLAIARRFTARLDADGAMFRSAVSRSGGTMQPQGLVEVRETPKGWSVRGRHEYQGKFALHHPDDLGASLDELRKGTGYKGLDREDVFGQYASTLLYLMKQCEQRLEPHPTGGNPR